MEEKKQMPTLDSISASIEGELSKMSDLISLIYSKLQQIKFYSEPNNIKFQELSEDISSPNCFVEEMSNKLLRFSELNERLEFTYRHLQEII